MSKRFLITEDERNSILSLYTKKGIIIEQKEEPRINRYNRKQTNDGKNEGKTFYTPSFSTGSYGLTIQNNTLYYAYNESEEDFNKYIYTESPVNFGGNYLNFTVDLFNKKITNSEFIQNQIKVGKWGGFASVKKDDSPSITEAGFQVVMINFPTSEAIPGLPRFEPNLCTVVINVARIDILNNEDHHPRTRSNSPIINLTQYYIPKNKKEWYMLRENVDTMYTEGWNATLMSFRDFKRNKLGIYLKDYWPREAFGKSKDPTPPKPVSIKISLDIKNPFTFDTTNLEGNGPQDLENFINDVKKQKRMYGEDVYNNYINFLNNYTDEKTGRKGILVTTSASIDDNPDGNTADSNKGGSTFLDCRVPGGRTRKSYNLCLSEARATVILQKLNSDLPEITNFVPNPIGETDMYDENAKWPKVTGTDEQKKAQTAINRRLIITLPEYNANLPTN
jgi:hypothetical protein